MRSISLGFVAMMCNSAPVWGCDEFVSRLLTKAIQASIESLGCRELEQAGLDKPEHTLNSVCYLSSGAISKVEIVADLKCKTSDEAFIRTQVSERVTAVAEVQASDCRITTLRVNASDDLGNILIKAFDAEGEARKALQKALQDACS